MKYRYLNAVMYGNPHMYFQTKRQPGAPVRDVYPMYGDILASYTFWRAYQHYPLRTVPYVFGDSGGYSVVTKGEVVDPVRLIRWQLRNCNDGVLLDLPPYSATGSAQFGGSAADTFHRNLAGTVEGVRRARPIYLEALEAGSEFRWWGVVQGESRAQMEEWYGTIAKVYPFGQQGEGWALAPKPSTDVIAIARHLSFARDMGLKRVHLLQVGGVVAVSVALALAVSGEFDYVSFDTATSTRLAVWRRFIKRDASPLGFDTLSDNHRDTRHSLCHKLMSECPCEACEMFREDKVPVTPGTEFSQYLLLHNDRALRGVYAQIYERAKANPEELIKQVAWYKFGEIMREWGGEVRAPSARRRVSIFDRV